MIDTHAHLDMLDDPQGALARAREAGVSRIVTIGSGVESCRASLAFAEREEGVVAALGIHPHGAGDATDGDVDELRRLLAHPQAVAVGEAGLDHYRDLSPRSRQAELFHDQASLAEELGKPLIVHTRAADEETLAVLRDVDVPVVLHCFSSTALLDPALEHGWYVSFAGNVTYPKATDLRWAANRVPENRLLAETDSPYLAPQPVRGTPNEPAHVVYTLAALAEVRGLRPDALEARIDENARELFGP